MDPEKKHYIFVEGGVGAGKTTLVELLKLNISNLEVIYEPVETFIDVKGSGNIYDTFLTNQSRWSFTANVYITLMHMQAVKKFIADKQTTIVVVDRSIYADYYIFGRPAYESGLITLLEWTIYQELFHHFQEHSQLQPSAFIYLKASPETISHRVKQRNRIEEKELSLDFICHQETYYNRWFIEKDRISENIAQTPTLILDANKDYKNNLIVQKEYLKLIKDFLQSL